MATVWDSPVLRLNPRGQTLTDVHWKVIIIKVVHMLQVPYLQLLNLFPLAHTNNNTAILPQ